MLILNKFTCEISQNSEIIFHVMINVLNNHQMHTERWENQIVTLHNKIAKQDTHLSKFQDTLNWADLSDFQDDFKKSVKLSDSLLLTDDKDLKFENWLSHIMNKLTVNNDHYITETLCMTYMKNQTEDNAVKHLISWLQSETSNCFRNIKKMLDHLKFIYLDFN